MMKQSFSILAILIWLPFGSYGQNVSINEDGSNPDPSSMLEVSDTTRGILIPRLNISQRNGITNPATGLLIYQINSDSGFYFNQGTPASPNWLKIRTEADAGNWSVLSSNLYTLSGNVGIGLNNPIRRLSIFDNSSPILRLSSQNSSGFSNGVISGAIEFSETIGTFESTDFYGFQLGYDGSNNRFRFRIGQGSAIDTAITILRSNGFVGINNDNPNASIHVHGNSLFADGTSSATSKVIIGPQTYSSSGKLQVWNTNFSGYALEAIGNNSSYSGAAVQFWNGGNGPTLNIDWAGSGDTNLVSYRSNGFLIGAVKTNGNAYFDGSLGLGTDAPTEKLQVSGGAQINYLGLNGTASSSIPLKVISASNNLAVRLDRNNGTAGWEMFVDASALNFCESGVACNRLVLEAGGDVGIGKFPSQKLDVAGNIALNGSTIHTSDRRFKLNIEPITDALSKITKVQGVYHTWNTEAFPERGFSDRKTMGLIAQDLEKQFPELVFEDEQGYLSVDYTKLTAVLIEAIKEQQVQIDDLRKELNELKSKSNE